MNEPLLQTLQQTRTADGRTLAELSQQGPLLVVFLRHSGCPFCRETLGRLEEKRPSINAAGVQTVLVHMSTDEDARQLFANFGADDLPRVSDPERKLYQAFDLQRGTAAQVAGPAVWWRGFKSTVLSGNLPGIPVGDVRQLPGAFLLVDGEIVRAFRSEDSAAQPDFDELTSCPLPKSSA